MKIGKIQLPSVSSLRGNRANQFYIFAFAPLLLVFYFYPLSAIISFYGFLILILKYQKLFGFKQANSIQKILGSFLVVGSFFVYYVVVLVRSGTAFYTAANYTVYLFGLFLVFFDFSALKEAFSPLFLIVAATSSSSIAAWLKPFLSPYANDIAYIILNILRALGIDASIFYYNNTPVFAFTSLSGKIVNGAFVYECLGVYSALVFSIILIVILFEDPGRLKVKLPCAIVGLLGTFALNILRVTIVFLVYYFYGARIGGTIHYVIGYALFSVWLAIFFYVFSKRRVISKKFQLIWQKLRS
ncbi:MAG: exosortase/archaeosortase family protein [Candidatus Bathyarchaeota archaeon]|nr:exosortase/archaeosortase family protein [Candidatus Bathyarchaeota archaeon]